MSVGRSVGRWRDGCAKINVIINIYSHSYNGSVASFVASDPVGYHFMTLKDEVGFSSMYGKVSSNQFPEGYLSAA